MNQILFYFERLKISKCDSCLINKTHATPVVRPQHAGAHQQNVNVLLESCVRSGARPIPGSEDSDHDYVVVNDTATSVLILLKTKTTLLISVLIRMKMKIEFDNEPEIQEIDTGSRY